MNNIFHNLYEDSAGRFWKLLEDDDELIDYCEENGNIDSMETVQELYYRLRFDDYLNTEYIEMKKNA